jgi:hypothetical protein
MVPWTREIKKIGGNIYQLPPKIHGKSLTFDTFGAAQSLP